MEADGPAVLRGKAVIVTGGGTGIGRAAARAFADQGAEVMIVGRTGATLQETADGWPGIRPLVADVAIPTAAAKVVAAAFEAFGRLDVLVNNAAITRPAPLGRVDPDLAQQQIAINLVAPLLLAQAAMPHLEDARGTIVNVTSNPPLRGWPRNSVYGATKAGLDFLTHTWALELAPQGIRVVAIAPGVTDTPVMIHAGLSREELQAGRERLLSRIPLGRRATPQEIAWWMVTMTRPEADYVTGAVLRVDGGLSVAF